MNDRQISITGVMHARLVAEAVRRGNGERSRGDLVDIVEEALAGGDWNDSLESARANRVVAVSCSRNDHRRKPERTKIMINDGTVATKIRALDAAQRSGTIDRAINRALDEAGVP
jgi:hypothetical protein